jgi:hypothetical protein
MNKEDAQKFLNQARYDIFEFFSTIDYKDLIKRIHPDKHSQADWANKAMAELTRLKEVYDKIEEHTNLPSLAAGH